MTQTPGLIEVGIDWLSASRSADMEREAEWHVECLCAIDDIAQHGNVSRETTYQGYTGWWSAGAFAGRRDDGSFVRVTGAWAEQLFSRLYWPGCKASRIDIQCTYRYTPEDMPQGPELREIASQYNASLDEFDRRKIHQHSDDDGGFSLYLGSRSSAHFMRGYNKQAESQLAVYLYCWRWEIQYQKHAAAQVADYIMSSNLSRTELITRTVSRYMLERGLTPPWGELPGQAIPVRLVPPITDYERKLAWLKRQVAPTIRLLQGHIDPAILNQALGIDPSDEPR